MKKIRYLFIGAMFIAQTAQSQALLHEDFIYTAGVPLVQNPMVSTENIDPTTGWRTMSNTNSATNAFNIVSPGLTYTGFNGSGKGNAMKILDNAGQDVFKSFAPVAPLTCPKTIYITFLINVPPGDKSGSEFIFGIKYTNSALDANYFGRLFISVTADSLSFGISKSSTPAGALTGMTYRTNTTYLLVLKYTCGGLNGTTSTEEANKYDDKVDLFINPNLSAAEPATPTLTYSNPVDKDAYRYGTTNTVIGGLAALYFRTPAVGGIPEAVFDGIRVADRWGVVTNTADVVAEKFKLYTDGLAHQLNVQLEHNSTFNRYEIVNLTGQVVGQGKINQAHFSIDAHNLNTGLYLLNLSGDKGSSAAKFVFY